MAKTPLANPRQGARGLRQSDQPRSAAPQGRLAMHGGLSALFRAGQTL